MAYTQRKTTKGSISLLSAFVMLTTFMFCAVSACDDIPPDSKFSCPQQAQWGKCNEPWMKNKCKKSCRRCDGNSGQQPIGGNAQRGNINPLPFSHPNSKGRSGAYFIPNGAPSNGMPVLVVFHGMGGNGHQYVNTFKAFAEKHKFALVAPESAGKSWKPQTKGQSTSDMKHAQAALAWIRKQVGESKHIGAFGHSYGARMSSSFGTNTPGIRKTAISHGRYEHKYLGESKTELWVSGTPGDKYLNREDMVTAEKEWKRGGTKLRIYPGAGHWPSNTELNDFVQWFLK